MNRTIYVYWYGDNHRKQELIKYYKSIEKIISSWKIELGPSEEEHQYLLKTYPYYKKSFELGIFALCSDVYRTYKIYENGGLYIDSGCKFNLQKIKSLLDKIEKYNYCFVLERPYYFWNGFFWFKHKNEIILNNCLKFMDKAWSNNFDHTVIMPIFLSKYIFKDKGYKIEKNSNILILKSFEFDPKNKDNVIYMNPSGSWWNKVNRQMKRSYTPEEGWINSYKSFKNSIRLLSFKRKIYTNLFFNKLFTYKFIYNIICKILK